MASPGAERCSACGFSWTWDAADAVAMVAGSPAPFADAVAGTAQAGAASDQQRLAIELLWQVVDALRLGTERLWSLAHDPASDIPTWDADAASRLRAGSPLSATVGLVAYGEAVAQWVGAARLALGDEEATGAGPGRDVAAGVIRGNAHDAQHHLLDIERLAGPSPGGVRAVVAAHRPGRAPVSVPGEDGHLFDEYLMVDWSANSTPRTGRDSIWIASGSWRRGALQRGQPSNPPTRQAAMAEIDRTVETCLDGGRRIIVGFDFPLSYPAGLTSRFPAVFGPGAPWRAVWKTLAERIEDKADNRNNRWEVAVGLNRETGCRLFWGCPSSQAGRYLAINDKPVPGLSERGEGLDRFRLTEQHARRLGGAIQSVWKLAYAGSVGSQSLLGIPRLEAMRSHYGDRLGVWPFEPVTAPGADTPPVVLTEIWPSIFVTDWTRHPVRDAAQVLEVVSACAEADRRGVLAGWLAPRADPAPAEQITEEGWILGVV